MKLLAVIRDNPPTCCEQTTFSAPLEGAYAKHGQHLQYGSPEHRAQYALMRSTNEGFNGAAKVGGLQDPTVRRKRGLAAQTLAALALLVAVNIRRINKFLANATRDRDGVVRVTKAPHEANKVWGAGWDTENVEDDDAPPSP